MEFRFAGEGLGVADPSPFNLSSGGALGALTGAVPAFGAAGAALGISDPSIFNLSGTGISNAMSPSPSQPGKGMSGPEQLAMGLQAFGEIAHGAGNIVRAARGMPMQPFQGTTYADRLKQDAAAKQSKELLEMLLGKEDKVGEEKMSEGLEAGLSSGMDIVKDEDKPEQMKEDLLGRVKVTRAKPFIDFYYERGEPLPQHIQDMLDGKNTLN